MTSSCYSLFRDDDISFTTDWRLLQEAHDIIVRAGRVHTVAVLMFDLWENHEVWYWLMTAKNLRIGLHGWRHSDYGAMPQAEIEADIRRSLDYWREHTVNYRNPPSIESFYPPWHRSGPALEAACKACGLALDARKSAPVYCFHSWELIQPEPRARLEKAVRE